MSFGTPFGFTPQQTAVPKKLPVKTVGVKSGDEKPAPRKKPAKKE